MNQPPGQPPYGNPPPPPQGYPQQPYPQQQQQQPYPQQPYPQQQQQPYPQQPYPQQPYPQQPYPQQQGAYGPPQGAPNPQAGWPAPPGGAPNGSWASDGPAERNRNAALSTALAPNGRWQNLSRTRGAGIFALGLLLLAINIGTIIGTDRYYIQALLFTPVALLTGLYMLIVGAPIDPHTRQLATWAKIGYGVSAAFGIFLGIIALVLVGC